MEPYLSTSAPSRNFQPRVGFGPTFPGAGFDTTWSIAHAQLPNQSEQEFQGGVAMIAQPVRDPFAPQLHSVFEAERARMSGGLLRRLRHQQADQVIGQEVDPDLLFIHLWSVATQLCHLQGRFNRAQKQSDILPNAVA
jgi:hypothetical protein